MSAPREVVLYVDIEHAKARATHERWQRGHAARVGRLAPEGVLCEYVWYGDFGLEAIARVRPLAVFISGNTTEWVEYESGTPSLAPLRAFIASDDTRVPILAVCGGHQLVAQAFGAAVRRMPGGAEEHGRYFDVRCERADPIFAGLRETPRFMEFHHDEVAEVHRDFVHLASTEACAVQALRHRTRTLYSTQFHPEQDLEADVPAGDGCTFVRNFLELALRAPR